MKNLKIIIIIISIIFILLVSLNIFTSPQTLERGDNYYEILAAKGILKYNLQPLGDYDLFQYKSYVLLNHFPAFNYFLAILIIIFHTSLALNMLGIVFIIGSGILSLKIARLVYEEVSDQTLIILYISIFMVLFAFGWCFDIMRLI